MPRLTAALVAMLSLTIPGRANGDGVFVALPDPAPKACAKYTGSARRFRIPRLEDLEVFEVQDRRGDGRTFTLEPRSGRLVVGVPR